MKRWRRNRKVVSDLKGQKGAPIFIKTHPTSWKMSALTSKLCSWKRDWSLQIGPRKLKKSTFWSLKSPEILRKVTTNAKSLTFIVKRVPEIEKCLVLNLLKLGNFDQNSTSISKISPTKTPQNPHYHHSSPLLRSKIKILTFDHFLINQT